MAIIGAIVGAIAVAAGKLCWSFIYIYFLLCQIDSNQACGLYSSGGRAVFSL